MQRLKRGSLKVGKKKKKNRLESNFVRKRTIFLSDWNRSSETERDEPPADPHFPTSRRNRSRRGEEELSRRGELCDASMALWFALLLSSGHIFYLSCNRHGCSSFLLHFSSPSNLFLTSLSLSLSLSALERSTRLFYPSLSLFVFIRDYSSNGAYCFDNPYLRRR